LFQSLPLDNTKKQNTNKNTKRIFYYKVWDHVWKKIERKKARETSRRTTTHLLHNYTLKRYQFQKKKSPISWKLIHTIYSLLCCCIETILQRMPSNLVKMQKFQTFQKKGWKIHINKWRRTLKRNFFSWSHIRQNKKERKNWGRFLLNNDYFLHCNFEEKLVEFAVCFHKQKQIKWKNKQTSCMSTFQISNFQCRTWFFLHECMKKKDIFKTRFCISILTDIWVRIEF